MLIDSHCHFDRLKAAPDHASLQQLINDAKRRDIQYFLCVNVRQSDFESMRQKMAPFKEVFLSCGVHPLDVKDGLDEKLLCDYAKDKQVIAIGETGLDYFYAPETRKEQIHCFEQQIELACHVNKPIIIHTRDAREETIDLLKNGAADKVGGVIHCFTENMAFAEEAMNLGFYISVSGIITFKNAGELRSVIRQIPKERLLVETDSPYLAPIPHRGKENQPAFVRDVAEFVADLRGETYEELAEYTSQNFFSLFKQANTLMSA